MGSEYNKLIEDFVSAMMGVHASIAEYRDALETARDQITDAINAAQADLDRED